MGSIELLYGHTCGISEPLAVYMYIYMVVTILYVTVMSLCADELKYNNARGCLGVRASLFDSFV